MSSPSASLPPQRRRAPLCKHLATVVALLCLAAGGPSSLEAKEARPVADPGMAGQAICAFGADLHRTLATQQGNLFYSPYSIYVALSMAREGAGGETRAALDRVLHVSSDDGLGPSLAGLERALQPRMVTEYAEGGKTQVPAYALSVANRLWGQRDYGFQAPFLATLRDAYGAPLAEVDFNQPEAVRQRINAWVAQVTRERIQDLVPAGTLTPLTRLVLANAVYLKAPWQTPFSERATEEDEFRRADGTTRRVPFLRAQRRLKYGEAAGFRWVALPYRGDLEMRIFLSAQEAGHTVAERELAGSTLRAQDGVQRLVNLRLPRFKFSQAFDLSATLGSLGLSVAFDAEQADFSGMTERERLYIGAALHKAFVAVDEEGTEAAAATALVLKGLAAAPPEEPITFHADRPFLFSIQHAPSGAALFLGRVVDPIWEP